MNATRTRCTTWAVGLLFLFALPVGCMVEDAGELDRVDTPSYEQQQQKGDSPGAGARCTVPPTGTQGTLNGRVDGDGNCCGHSRCTDLALCGGDFGKYTWGCQYCDSGTCTYPDDPSGGPATIPVDDVKG